jgi:hypothetical protein
LQASGAVAISIDEAGAIKTGKTPSGVATFWTRATQGRALGRRARRYAGAHPDIATATAALHRAAHDLRISITPHSLAIDRAGGAALRLDRYLLSLKGTGATKEFSRQYRMRRLAAKARGDTIDEKDQRI